MPFVGALRLFRRVVQLKDDYYNRHIVRDNVMQAVVECFKKNGHRYNLLNSAIIELFDFIRTVSVCSSRCRRAVISAHDSFCKVNIIKDKIIARYGRSRSKSKSLLIWMLER